MPPHPAVVRPAGATRSALPLVLRRWILAPVSGRLARVQDTRTVRVSQLFESWRAPRTRMLLFTIVAALALRVALLPLGHWWDLTVDYNVFIDIAHGRSPYDTFRSLTNIAQSAHWWPFYEYYAYPPAPLYIYWPFAHLFAWLHPAATNYFPIQRSFAMPSLPWDFYLWFKLPIWAADFAIAAVLARLTGTVRMFGAYLLNPFVLLVSGAWTFDALMVLALVLGVYWLQKGQHWRAGAALAVGTMIKFVPLIVLPVFALYLIKRQRSARDLIALIGSFVVVCIVLVGPFADGIRYVLGFQSARNGGGMNWEPLVSQLSILNAPAGSYATAAAIGAFGTPALVIALLIVYGYCFIAEMPLSRMVLLTLVTYFVATKLVNEQYVLAALPFTLIEAHRLRGVWNWIHHAFWITALTSAIFSVPIDRFLWPLYYTVFGSRANLIVTTAATGLDTHLFPWRSAHLDAWVVLALGGWFTVLCFITLFCPARQSTGKWSATDFMRRRKGVAAAVG
jgi:hypothetical protein